MAEVGSVEVARDPEVRQLRAQLKRAEQDAPTAPNQVWVGDITCRPRQGGGWRYLATWLDRYSRKVVGWDVRGSVPEDLVSGALCAAPWPYASQQVGQWSIPTKAARTRLPTSRAYLPATRPYKA